MNLNDTAAAYGLFQVVFADVVDHIAVATFRLREHSERGLVFESVFDQKFRTLLKQFQQELKQFDGCSLVADSLHGAREAYKTILKLKVWRNDRIHARVRMSEDGSVLSDWRTRPPRRLEITKEQIEQNINRAIKAIADLEAHVPQLVGQLKWDEEFEKLLSNLPEFSNSPEDTPADDEASGG